MSASAKDQIVSAFLDLLTKKPLDKLNVTNIVQASGVTRQTFYYHFQDVPALISFIVCRYADDVGSRAARASSMEEAVSMVFAPVWECPDLVRQFMESKKYPASQIIYREVRGHLIRFFRLRRLKIGMEHRSLDIAATYYACAVMGVIAALCDPAEPVDRALFEAQMCRLVCGDIFQNGLS